MSHAVCVRALGAVLIVLLLGACTRMPTEQAVDGCGLRLTVYDAAIFFGMSDWRSLDPMIHGSMVLDKCAVLESIAEQHKAFEARQEAKKY